MEPCIIIVCNRTGNRLRRRKCLYGDGSETSNAKLCFNQSSVVTKTCISDKICSKNIGTINSDLFISFNLAAIRLFLLICLLILCFIFKRCSHRHKQEQVSAEQSHECMEIEDGYQKTETLINRSPSDTQTVLTTTYSRFCSKDCSTKANLTSDQI